MNMGNHTTSSDGGLDEGVEFLISYLMSNKISLPRMAS